MSKKQTKKIAIVVTSLLQIKFFLVPHIRALSEIYDVTIIVKNDHPEILAGLNLDAKILEVSIERKISPIKDLMALFSLCVIFRKNKFDLIHTMTPKAGLLGTMASWLHGCPIRLHTFQGEVWANKTGFFRVLLRACDVMVARLATHVTVVSFTERSFLIEEGVVSAKKISVIANGSICGVDLERYSFDKEIRGRFRNDFHVADDETLFVYVGRLSKDKGVNELIVAFERLSNLDPKVSLLVVGPDEDHFTFKLSQLNQKIPGKVNIISYTPDPQIYMMAADVLVLPSHREGFGVVVIEAAALGIPSIGTNVYGIQDSIVDNETGILFELKNSEQLCIAMQKLANDGSLRHLMGRKAQERVRLLYDQRLVVKEMLNFYRVILLD